MKTSDLIIVSSEKFNSNNSWGFGGMRGERTVYSNGLVLLSGTRCFRHSFNNSHSTEWYINTDDFGSIELKNHKLLKSGCSIFKVEWYWQEYGEKHPMIPYYICSDSEANAIKYFKKVKKSDIYFVDTVSLVIE